MGQQVNIRCEKEVWKKYKVKVEPFKLVSNEIEMTK